MPVWAGFLIVGALYAVVAGVLYANGKNKHDRINPKPEQTTRSRTAPQPLVERPKPRAGGVLEQARESAMEFRAGPGVGAPR